MAEILYPAQLPKPLQDGYALERFDPVRRTPLITGRSFSRRVYESVPDFVDVSFLFTEIQASFFRVWFDKKLDGGAARFNVELQTPDGLALRDARFTEMYKGPVLVGPNYWRVTARLELKPVKNSLLEDWIDFPEFLFGANVIDVATNREWPDV